MLPIYIQIHIRSSSRNRYMYDDTVYWYLGQPVAPNWNPNHALVSAIVIMRTSAFLDLCRPARMLIRWRPLSEDFRSTLLYIPPLHQDKK